MYYYLLRGLPNEWVATHEECAFNRRQVISDQMKKWDVVATAVRTTNNPLYQNWIYRMHSGIFVWADCSDKDAEVTVDTLTAFGVPDWSGEVFHQHTTIAVMYSWGKHSLQNHPPGGYATTSPKKKKTPLV